MPHIVRAAQKGMLDLDSDIPAQCSHLALVSDWHLQPARPPLCRPPVCHAQATLLLCLVPGLPQAQRCLEHAPAVLHNLWLPHLKRHLEPLLARHELQQTQPRSRPRCAAASQLAGPKPPHCSPRSKSTPGSRVRVACHKKPVWKDENTEAQRCTQQPCHLHVCPKWQERA